MIAWRRYISNAACHAELESSIDGSALQRSLRSGAYARMTSKPGFALRHGAHARTAASGGRSSPSRTPGPMPSPPPPGPRHTIDVTTPLAEERHRRAVAEMVTTTSYPELDAVLGRWPGEMAQGEVAVYGLLQAANLRGTVEMGSIMDLGLQEAFALMDSQEHVRKDGLGEVRTHGYRGTLMPHLNNMLSLSSLTKALQAIHTVQLVQAIHTVQLVQADPIHNTSLNTFLSDHWDPDTPC